MSWGAIFKKKKKENNEEKWFSKSVIVLVHYTLKKNSLETIYNMWQTCYLVNGSYEINY